MGSSIVAATSNAMVSMETIMAVADWCLSETFKLFQESCCFLFSSSLPVLTMSYSKQQICLKVYGYTFRGSKPAIFNFASLLRRGQLLKE